MTETSNPQPMPSGAPSTGRRGRPRRLHDNRITCALLVHAAMLLPDSNRFHSMVDDILTGVLELDTAGSTSTRTLSRDTLRAILTHCPVIGTAEVKEAMNNRLADRTIEEYCLRARVASKAIEDLARGRPGLIEDALKLVTSIEIIDRLPDELTQPKKREARLGPNEAPHVAATN